MIRCWWKEGRKEGHGKWEGHDGERVNDTCLGHRIGEGCGKEGEKARIRGHNTKDTSSCRRGGGHAVRKERTQGSNTSCIYRHPPHLD